MFIRESKTRNKKTGKVYVKHSLVESIRTERGPRQRLVMTLGRLAVDREHWKQLATALEAFLSGKEELMYLAGFELSEEVLSEIARTRAVARTHQSRLSGKMTTGSCAPAPIYQEVDVMSVQCSDTRTLGPELAAHQAWELLEFNKLLGRCGFSPREQALAATVIWGRLIQPGSDLSTWQWLRERSSLSEFVEADISRVHKDQVYQIADKLLLHKDQLEEELYEQQCTLFSGRESLFIFDLTNFYFEGRCAENELAKRGKSKEKRQQNPLVSLALLVDQDGFPVKSKVYKGNVSEPMTLKEVLSGCGLLDSESLFRPTVAMDRGIATKESIALLREYDFPFVVIERADRRHQYADEFIKREQFDTIEDSKGQKIHLKKLGEKVLCTSETRKEKEQAMADRWIAKAEEDLKTLQQSVQKGHFKKSEVIHDRLDKIKTRYPKFDEGFAANYVEADKTLIYKHTEHADDPGRLHGCYVIEFDQVEGDAESIWRTYTTLTRVEAAFRSMKTDLGTRPVYHQGGKRTEAHLFLSILAYHMLINIEHRLKAAGENMRWHTLREHLASHQRSTIIWTNKEKETWSKRVSGTPEMRHLQMYGKLGITNPLNDQLLEM
jgi:transposase